MDVQELQVKVKAVPYWYHRIELPGGIVTPGWSPIYAERYCVPQDLTGKRVLDIGAWDGYWTWEALKRGAREVVAIDDFSDDCGAPDKIKRNGWETFDLCREAFGFTERDNISGRWLNEKSQSVQRMRMSIYDLAVNAVNGVNEVARFDVVFFFGTIYHLRHPLLALERIASVCDGSIYVETASLDEYSPYRGGIGHGFDQNEMVMEFYPGGEYGSNPGNWWAPTLQCLGAMLSCVGFQDVECWPLTETPKNLSECRGFASGTKDPVKEPAGHPAEVAVQTPPVRMKVAAVESVPRLGFMDNKSCVYEALTPLKIPVISVQGAFWGQCLERGIQQMADAGVDVVLTLDYDTVFKRSDVETILRLIYQHPEAAAVLPIQRGRGGFPVLASMKTLTGQPRSDVPLAELKAETVRIASGHFGLTALRVKDLLDIPHPWFWDQPNCDGQWGPGRTDADIWFWKQLEKAGKTVLLASRVAVGHLELMVKWPDESLETIYQATSEFHDKGKPKNCWK
jgi:tRNA (mo5U34)-methyltransferase